MKKIITANLLVLFLCIAGAINAADRKFNCKKFPFNEIPLEGLYIGLYGSKNITKDITQKETALLQSLTNCLKMHLNKLEKNTSIVRKLQAQTVAKFCLHATPNSNQTKITQTLITEIKNHWPEEWAKFNQ